MKKIILFLIAFIALAPLSMAQGSEDSNEVAQIKFSKTEHIFGDIIQGDSVQTIFKFTNTGTAPLVLTNVSVTCGCTAPYWPREAIMPGDEGEIRVKFRSAGKSGAQNKVITIYSNAANNPERVKIVTNVLKP